MPDIIQWLLKKWQKKKSSKLNRKKYCSQKHRLISKRNPILYIFMFNSLHEKLEWGCPNGTKYPPRQPIPNRVILPNRARLQTDRRTDGQGDSSIPPPPNFVAGGIKNYHFWRKHFKDICILSTLPPFNFLWFSNIPLLYVGQYVSITIFSCFLISL